MPDPLRTNPYAPRSPVKVSSVVEPTVTEREIQRKQEMLRYFAEHGAFEDVNAAIDEWDINTVWDLINSFYNLESGTAYRHGSLANTLSDIASSERYAGRKNRLSRAELRDQQGLEGDQLGRSLGVRGVQYGGLQKQSQRRLAKGQSRARRGLRNEYRYQLEGLGQSRRDANRASSHADEQALQDYHNRLALALQIKGRS